MALLPAWWAGLGVRPARPLSLALIAALAALAALSWRVARHVRPDPEPPDAAATTLPRVFVPGKSAQKTAQRLNLPLSLGKWRLRRVLHAAPGASLLEHALYSNGRDTLSVFVFSQTGRTLSPGAHWHPLSLQKNTAAFRHQDAHGRTAIAWQVENRQYIVTSGQSAGDLMKVARAFCTKTQDRAFLTAP